MGRSGAAQKRLQPWLATVATSPCLLSMAAQRPMSMLLLMPGQSSYGMYAQLSTACIAICRGLRVAAANVVHCCSHISSTVCGLCSLLCCPHVPIP